jgi:hypothetical protein
MQHRAGKIRKSAFTMVAAALAIVGRAVDIVLLGAKKSSLCNQIPVTAG